MSARTYWDTYVSVNGGAIGVAAKLAIPYSTIAGVCNGSRGIGRRLAQRMVESDPSLDANQLVWVTPIDKLKQPDVFGAAPAESAGQGNADAA